MQPLRFCLPRKRRRTEENAMDVNPAPEHPVLTSKALLNSITKHAHQTATLQCQYKNLSDRITALRADLANGTTPKHLEYKFKKLLSKPEEAGLKASYIKLAIDSEIASLIEKCAELKNLDETRHARLNNELNNVLQSLNIDPDIQGLQEYYDAEILEFRIAFSIKQTKDLAAKELKRTKFLERTEAGAEPSNLTVKESNAMKAQISKLTKKMSKLSSSTPGKGKGGASGSPRASPNPAGQTGTGKGRNGRRNATATGKRSPGKNGK